MRRIFSWKWLAEEHPLAFEAANWAVFGLSLGAFLIALACWLEVGAWLGV